MTWKKQLFVEYRKENVLVLQQLTHVTMFTSYKHLPPTLHAYVRKKFSVFMHNLAMHSKFSPPKKLKGKYLFTH